MQWSAEPNAGFTEDGVDPWLPVDPGYSSINVDSGLDDPESTLNLYRRLLQLRREHSALRIGSFLTHPSSTEEVFAYRRESDSETMTVVLNRHRLGRCRAEVALAPREGIVISH